MTIHNSIINRNVNVDINAHNVWQWRLDHSPVYKYRHLADDCCPIPAIEVEFDEQPFSD